MWTVRPSTQPKLASPSRNFANWLFLSLSSSAVSSNTPTRRMRSPGCCARAESGQAAAAPPINKTKSRRLIASPEAYEHCFKLAQSKACNVGSDAGRRMADEHPAMSAMCHKQTLPGASRCPLCAISRHSALRHGLALFDHLVGEHLHLIGDGQPQRSGGLQIDNQF